MSYLLPRLILFYIFPTFLNFLLMNFRSIGCIVVSVFHVCWFGAFSVDNQVTLFAHGEQISWQWLSTAPFVVDMFFTISGFLLAYNFLQNQKRIDEIRSNTLKKNLRLFGKQLLSRYLRSKSKKSTPTRL